jgi:enolase 1/2/3
MTAIRRVFAREILDSRGNPTVEVDVDLASGARGRACVPSGASTGSREALELRDGDKTRYHGRGVRKAVMNVNEQIAPKVVGREAIDQTGLDEFLARYDGTPNKSRLGANAVLGVSLAVARAAAAERKEPLFAYLSEGRATLLPLPLMNFVNGGAHADNNLEFQEIMIVPHGADSFREALRTGSEIFHALKRILHENGLSSNVGDEGGFAPQVHSEREAIELVMKGILAGGYHPGRDVSIAIDAAATEFHEKARGYVLEPDAKPLSSGELVDHYVELVRSYPIVSLEDGMAEDDWDGWTELTKKLGDKIQLVGDDIFVTNPEILQQAIRKGVANAILLKVNQIGTLTETRRAAEMAKAAGYGRVVSHRSGETEDTTIAHLAVAWETGQIKTGSVSRSDRIAKYNELLRIEEELGSRARYARLDSLPRSPQIAREVAKPK